MASRFCGWCDELLELDVPDLDGHSHGICKPCGALLETQSEPPEPLEGLQTFDHSHVNPYEVML